MKRLWGLVCASALVVGCGPDIDLAARPLFSNGVNTVTFIVYDGLTGAGVENAELRILVGGYTVEARRDGNIYVVSQLPAGTFPTFIDAPGYLSFVGSANPTGTGTLIPSVTATGTVTNPGPATQTYRTYQVVLYPDSRVADDIVVKAYESDDGTPVVSGTVVATLTGATTFLGVTLDNLMPGSFTTRPTTLIASITANGTAILPKDRLILGGTYSVDIFGAANVDGLYLTPQQNVTITAGESFPAVTLFLGPPAQTPVALTANNEDPDGVFPSLVVTFPYPMQVCSLNSAHEWSFYSRQQDPDDLDYDLDDDGNVTAPPAENQLTVAVDGGTVTITPNFATGAGAFDPGDGEMIIQFSGVKLRVTGTSSCTDLSNINLRNTGSKVSTRLTINAAIE